MPDLCREHGFSNAQFYKWRSKFGGMDMNLMKRMKKLEEENRRLKKMYAERGIIVSYESIRLWCNKFGPADSRRLKRRHHGYGDTFYIDEVFVKIGGKQHYLWRAIDQDPPALSQLSSAFG